MALAYPILLKNLLVQKLPNRKVSMNSKAFRPLGTLVYWLAWPAWFIYFKIWHRRSRVLVFAEGKLLLTKSWLGNNDWSLPGGGAKIGESIEMSATRELKEEVNITIEEKDLEFITSFKHKNHGYSFDATFFALELKKTPKLKLQTGEVMEADWFTSSEMKKIKKDVDIISALKQYKGGVWYNK